MPPSLGATYTKVSSKSDAFGTSSADNLLLGAAYTFDALSLGAVYGKVMNAQGDLNGLDDGSAYGLTGQYDLGGGATVNGGIFQSYQTTNSAATTPRSPTSASQ